MTTLADWPPRNVTALVASVRARCLGLRLFFADGKPVTYSCSLTRYTSEQRACGGPTQIWLVLIAPLPACGAPTLALPTDTGAIALPGGRTGAGTGAGVVA